MSLLDDQVSRLEPALLTATASPLLWFQSLHATSLCRFDRCSDRVPRAIEEALLLGVLETPKPRDFFSFRNSLRMIATSMQSLQAAADKSHEFGITPYILSDEIEGGSREIGKMHAALARIAARGFGPFQRPCVILSGGETTVNVREFSDGINRGRGGRSGEFSMGLAAALQEQEGVWALAADTDGIDGIEDNAGAFVSPDTLKRASDAGLKLSEHLMRNDVYGYFNAIGDLLITGPTHTNVNDFRALLIL